MKTAAAILALLIAASPAVAQEFLDGVQLVTSDRELRGLLVREDGQQVLVKTGAAPAPVAVPKSSILQRSAARVREDEAYTLDELIEARASRAGSDAAGLLSAGRFAAALRRHERADDLYRRAAAADPGLRTQADALLAENTAQRREAMADAELARIRQLAQKADKAGAAEAARKFLVDFAGTDVAAQNSGIADELAAKVVEGLAGSVPALWRSRRSALLAQVAGPGTRLADARAQVARLDEEIVKDLAANLKADPAEIRKAWENRDEKLHVATYGAGSWIVGGGQDGGLDWQPPPPPPSPPPGTEEYIMIPVRDAQGRVLYYVRAPVTPPRPPAPKARGHLLQTADEWWTRTTPADRKTWLEAEYALTSGQVLKIEELRKACSHCMARGTLDVVRTGEWITTICPRCHGARQDLSVRFK